MPKAIGKTAIFLGVLGVGGAISAFSCGITQPKYIDYDPESVTATTTATDSATGTDTSSGYASDTATTTDAAAETAECAAARTEFETNVQPKVVATCATASCHLATQIKGAVLSETDAAVNRTQLKLFADGVAETLFEKISGTAAGGHGGSDVSAALPLATITAWIDKEAACQ
jgi:hypothetical protein